MKVSDIMTHDPACCTPESSLVEASKMMKDSDCGSIPVVEDSASLKPIGIITDRDVVVRAVAEAKDPFITTVGDIMTKSLITVKSDQDVKKCLELMEKQQVKRILAVDDDGAVVGIVSQAEIARSLDKEVVGEVVEDISRPTMKR